MTDGKKGARLRVGEVIKCKDCNRDIIAKKSDRMICNPNDYFDDCATKRKPTAFRARVGNCKWCKEDFEYEATAAKTYCGTECRTEGKRASARESARRKAAESKLKAVTLVPKVTSVPDYSLNGHEGGMVEREGK